MPEFLKPYFGIYVIETHPMEASPLRGPARSRSKGFLSLTALKGPWTTAIRRDDEGQASHFLTVRGLETSALF